MRYSVFEDEAKEVELKKLAKECRRLSLPQIISNDSKSALLRVWHGHVLDGENGLQAKQENHDDVIVIEDDNETAAMPNNSSDGNVLDQLPEGAVSTNETLAPSTVVRARAPTGKKFKCDQCSYAAANKRDLKVHKLTHTGEKPHKCSQCSYACSKVCNLKRHMATSHSRVERPKPFQCDQCNFAATSSCDLKRHILRLHTGEKPFKCDQCSYATTTSDGLNSHKMTHTGEKPFKCDFPGCNYATITNCQLSRHKRTHTKEKPHSCDLCPFTTSHSTTLKDHKKVKHTTFSSAVSPNEFKIVFEQVDESLTVFREINYRLREKLELKKDNFGKAYTLERCSLPPIVFDFLHYLSRNELERLSIVCRPLKNLINRYFGAKPYRIFDRLYINEGSYALYHKDVQWHPNQDDYSVQQFLARQECSIGNRGYSFAEMRPYLGPSVRINWTYINVAGDVTYNSQHVAEMESISYLWRDGKIRIWNTRNYNRIVAEHFQPVLNSPTILQCQYLTMDNAHFSFKDYNILYSVKVIEINYANAEIDPNYWSQFLEQPGVKPLVILRQLHPDSVVGMLERLYKDFSSAISPNAYKIVFAQIGRLLIKSIVESFKKVNTFSEPDEELIEFQDWNKTSGEKWEFKKRSSAEFRTEYPEYELSENNKYVLERSVI
ncbi:zinc-finger double domain-containing protein [Ditylenchus destructor]|uniref:Zinc-finger double domain-containing protein n=1 Tax=Ditylenchus destructor TaxID=166010 RepID=A0AAD4QSP1_9BILA|nr:zinc-finger double domain-containing protein [Ditylenchus destructor]